MSLLAIDPGTHETGYVIINADTYEPEAFGKIPNAEFLDYLDLAARAHDRPRVAIEQIGHYGTGMPAGRDVFDTCRFIGRCEQILDDAATPYDLVLRAKVKTHLCGNPRAKDPNVRQALVDRFAPGTGNYGKGTKAAPGWFYGFHADVWQAYALAVYIADTTTDDDLLAEEAAPF